jgi:hypothetical protein
MGQIKIKWSWQLEKTSIKIIAKLLDTYCLIGLVDYGCDQFFVDVIVIFLNFFLIIYIYIYIYIHTHTYKEFWKNIVRDQIIFIVKYDN